MLPEEELLEEELLPEEELPEEELPEEEELFFLRAERTEEGEIYSAVEDDALLQAIADAYEKEFLQKMKESGADSPSEEE